MPKTGRRLILSDGTVLENGECGYADGRLWCWVSGMTMAEAAEMFFDPGRTDHIVFEYGEMSDEYDGFTTCTGISIDSDGKISVCLTKG
jgi:hypothetical protein